MHEPTEPSAVILEYNARWTILFALLATCFAFYFHTSSSRKKKQDERSPPVAPAGILETIRRFAWTRSAPWFLEEMTKKTASDIFELRLPIGRNSIFIISDPAATREILLDKASDKPTLFFANFENLSGGPTMFTRESDDMWHKIRKGTRNAFSTMEVNRMNSICAEHVNQWIKNKLEPCIEANESFDPSHEMVRITFGVILEAAFEYTATEAEFQHFSHHVESALIEFGIISSKQSCDPLRKIYGLFLPKYRAARKSCLELQAFARNILNAYREKKVKSKNNTVIKLIVQNESFTDDAQRVAEIVSMLIGGHDTTGYSLGTVLVLLAKHPEVSEKLHNELLSMDADKRSECGYMRTVITESHRLLPVGAMGSVRKIGRDILCKEGSMIIPKGSITFLPQFVLHRNPDVFKDPEIFRPERWEDANKSMRDAVLPFSLGNRNCIGQSLATAEINSTLSKLFLDYRFEVEDEGKLDFFLTLKYVGARLKASRVDN